MISKQSASSDWLKHFILNMLIKILPYTVGAAIVLILIISAIPSLFTYLPSGNCSTDKQINKKHKLSVNHFNE